jgi:hypothetical protein
MPTLEGWLERYLVFSGAGERFLLHHQELRTDITQFLGYCAETGGAHA